VGVGTVTSRCLTVVSVVAETYEITPLNHEPITLLGEYATVTMTDGTLTITRRMPVFECPRLGTQYSGFYDPTETSET
jgi:hypothetical protein